MINGLYICWILIFILSLNVVNSVCIGKIYYLLSIDGILGNGVSNILLVLSIMTGISIFIVISTLVIKIHKYIRTKYKNKSSEDINL